MKTLPDDVLRTIADFLWFQSIAMKNACKQWQALIAGRYSINASTSTGMQCVLQWPPTVIQPSPTWMRGGGSLWINVSDTMNRPLLIRIGIRMGNYFPENFQFGKKCAQSCC